MTRLKVYSDRSLVPSGEPHVVALFPFWGREQGIERPRPDYADRLIEHGRDFFELTNLDVADIAIYPQDWKRVHPSPQRVEQAQAFAGRARAAGKPPVFFYLSDTTDEIPIEGATVFRTSFYRSRRGLREFAQPGFHEDLLDYCGGELPIRARPERPTVGFCGVALTDRPPTTAAARLRRFAGERRRDLLRALGRPLAEDVFVRERALYELERQGDVDSNIVRRDAVYGGAVMPLDMERWGRVRREFVDNIVGSDYVLCVRGVGNFSYRLYETLSLGRIPVFVDTDCVLPYDFLVDWREHCVWVERSELSSLGRKVAEFHARVSDAEFVERQHAARRLWEDYLSPEGFFANFHRHFG